MAKKKDEMHADGSITLCGANAYDKKYYFNQKFDKLPQSIQDELHIICVLFTEEVGGIFTIDFAPDGSVNLRTEAAEEDYLYDEIGSGLLVNEVTRKRRDLFESLSLYYRYLILHENVDDLIGAGDESGEAAQAGARYEKSSTPEDIE